LQENSQNSWTVRPTISRGLIWLLGALVGLGLVTFFVGVAVAPLRDWQSYLINFLFWSGLAQGAVIFAAIYHVVGGKWGSTVRRLAEGMAVFLPVSFVLFLPLYFGLEIFFRRVRELNPSRGAWFDPRFIFVRGALGLGLMTVLSLFFVYYSLRPEVGFVQEKKWRDRTWLHRWIAEGWRGEPAEVQRCERGLDFLAAGVLLAYPIIYTFMAFDLIMALDPFWYSSLFGGYFFVSTFYLGLAGLVVVVVLIRWSLGNSVITNDQLWDLGKLLLGFNLTYFAMAWAQYIVIWYGNLPEETHFVILRLWEMPWAPLSWAALIMSVLIPFLFFLSLRAKQIPSIILSIGILISVGLWLERYVLIVPSLWNRGGVPFGWIEVGITCGFLGAAGLSYIFFLQNFPVIPFTHVAPSVTPEKAAEGIS
jgi:hypothetical protein